MEERKTEGTCALPICNTLLSQPTAKQLRNRRSLSGLLESESGAEASGVQLNWCCSESCFVKAMQLRRSLQEAKSFSRSKSDGHRSVSRDKTKSSLGPADSGTRNIDELIEMMDGTIVSSSNPSAAATKKSVSFGKHNSY
jgi:hypothetical protein